MSDTLQTIFAGLAFTLSLVDFIWNIFQQRQCNQISQSSLKTEQGSLEVELRSRIEEAHENVMRWSEQLYHSEDDFLEMAMEHFEAAQESLRNAYENACSKYLQGMLNEDDFVSMYKKEIKDLVEDESHREHYRRWRTVYKNTVEVYDVWYSKSERR